MDNIFDNAVRNLEDVKFDNFTIKDKHLTTNSSGWRKFNTSTSDEAMDIVRTYANENNILSVVDNATTNKQSYQVILIQMEK